MPARLIVNADDFGLTHGVNRAVAELHEAGALTSATLMARGAAFGDAVQIARAYPTLGIGCHVVLTDGLPVLPAADIPSLIGPDGRSFRPSLVEFHLAVLRGAVSYEHILHEALAQVETLQRAGIRVTHLDTHKHTHILPQVARPLLEAAERAGVRAMRSPFEESWSRSLGHASLRRRLETAALYPLRRTFDTLPQIRSRTVATADGTIGISATGKLDAATLGSILRHMPSDGTWELVTHPGYNDRELDAVTTRLRLTREIEREALFGAFARPDGKSPQPESLELIHYGALASPTHAEAASAC